MFYISFNRAQTLAHASNASKSPLVLLRTSIPDGLLGIPSGYTVNFFSAGGGAFTVTLALPFTVPFEAFIAVLPAANAVNVVMATPSGPVIEDGGLTLPTDGLLTSHDISIEAIGLLFWSRAVALNSCVPPMSRVAVAGVTEIFVRTGCGGAVVTVILAFPFTVPFEAFIAVLPAANAVNVVMAIPFGPVIEDGGLTLPTDGLSISHDISIEAIGLLF